MNFKRHALCLAFALALLPTAVCAEWVAVAIEQGKRVEIDRDSIARSPGGGFVATGRVMLDKPIVDHRTSAAYRIIEVQNRFDCAERTYATLKRSYYKEEGELLRQEEVRSPFDMPVRTGTPDDRMMREVCRPAGVSPAMVSVNKTIERVNEVSTELRKANDALVEQAVKKDLNQVGGRSRAQRTGSGGSVAAERASRSGAPTNVAWAYEGAGAPDNWGQLKAANALCASGRRQSPIDIRDGIAVDLEPIQFDYRPAAFRVVDAGRNLQMAVYGGTLSLLGKSYELQRVHFHRPSEFTVGGKAYEMEAQLVHKAEDGSLAILAVLLELGSENPVIQAALNNLPLERNGEVAPPGKLIDPSAMLPADRRYYTFMGSLTTPPCTEDVLWLVLKQAQQISREQLAIFQRLYSPNARPVQPGFGRIIKESR